MVSIIHSLRMPDYYQILDLVPGATKEEIKKAYRRKVMEYHPDRNDSAEARQLFLRVKEAYEVLMGRAPRRRSSAPRGAAAGQGQTDHYAFYERV